MLYPQNYLPWENTSRRLSVKQKDNGLRRSLPLKPREFRQCGSFVLVSMHLQEEAKAFLKRIMSVVLPFLQGSAVLFLLYEKCLHSDLGVANSALIVLMLVPSSLFVTCVCLYSGQSPICFHPLLPFLHFNPPILILVWPVCPLSHFYPSRSFFF